MAQLHFEESYLHFEFDDVYWQPIIHGDKHADLCVTKNTIQQTKSVDFIGLYTPSQTWVFMEVTNYTKSPTGLAFKDGADTSTMDGLIQEFMQKYKDTLSCVIFASLAKKGILSGTWTDLVLDVVGEKKKIHAILWLEEDWKQLTSFSRNNRQAKYINTIFLGKLKQKFKKLVNDDTCVFVINKNNNGFNGLSVS